MTEAEWDDSRRFLLSAERIEGSRVRLHFEDGFKGEVDLAVFAIDWMEVCLRDISADPASLEFCRQAYNIDSAVLRARCDPAYAAFLKKQITQEMKS